MDKREEIDLLKSEIEFYRDEMEKTLNSSDMDFDAVLELSSILDQLIVRYYEVSKVKTLKII